ncbi:non-ribosomal peptide synthetase, partial [Photobacterium sp. DNB22_13_2]
GLERVGIEDNFFSIGGNSINAVQLIGEMQRTLNLNVTLPQLFSAKNIAALIAEELAEVQWIPATGAQSGPLSFAQERVLFLERFAPGGHTYHIPMLVALRPDTCLQRLEHVLNLLQQRHAVLRTVYRQDETGADRQQVLPLTPFSVPLQYRPSLDSVMDEVKTVVTTPFDLANEATMRCRAYEAGGQRYLLLLWHHIAFDGWSMALFLRELSELYAASASHRAEGTLSTPSISYLDYTLWQRDQLAHADDTGLDAYWQAQLAGIEALALTEDYPRPASFDYHGANFDFVLPEALSAALNECARSHQTTLYTVLLAGFYLMLSRLSGQQDIVIGAPSDNREQNQTQGLVGFFANTLPLRIEAEDGESVVELLARIHQTVIDAKAHQSLPFEKIVNLLGGTRDPARHPVFQVMFSLQHFGQDPAAFNHSPFELLDSDPAVSWQAVPAKFDLSLVLDDSRPALRGQFNYATSLFSPDTIARMAKMYPQILAQLTEGAVMKLADVELLNDEEARMMLHRWHSPWDGGQYRSFLDAFEARAAAEPQAIALRVDGQAWDYRTLDRWANRLAHTLLADYQQHYGQPMPAETPVAMYLDRHAEMVVVILAVMKAGGAYVPISTDYPAERTAYILSDTKAPLVVTQSGYRSRLAGMTRVVTLDEQELSSFPENAPERAPEPGQLAYILYTSGTTGQPKGVMIEHGVFVRFLEGMASRLSPADKPRTVLSLTQYTFDIFGLEYGLALMSGGCLILSDAERAHRDLQREHREIDLIQQTPSLWQRFLNEQAVTVDTRHIQVLAGGESGPQAL